MTTLTAAAGTSARPITSLDRAWRIVRLHYQSWRMSVLFPWVILVGILGVNLAIWYLIQYTTHGTTMNTQYTGSIAYLFIYQLVLATQLMNANFAFALGLSSTRRDFSLGTALFFVVQTAQFTAGFVLLTYIEQWTNGWGISGHMFQTVYVGTGPLWQRAFTVFFALLGCLFAGSILGAVFVRWRAYGLYVVFALAIAVLLAALALIGLTHSWVPVGEWFARNRGFGVVAWSLPVTAACGVIGFLALRRAVPRG